jgi:hypothetical protein
MIQSGLNIQALPYTTEAAPMNMKNTKAEILDAYDEQAAKLQEISEKLNIALALIATLIATNLLF